ncbi:hypothetical protein C8Q80DRAFT_1121249 [Daedaleopsis nitida]|nr:hypothetical protein C8Q80DRAFT_1121249 [Daedaleopsis nitida]
MHGHYPIGKPPYHLITICCSLMEGLHPPKVELPLIGHPRLVSFVRGMRHGNLLVWGTSILSSIREPARCKAMDRPSGTRPDLLTQYMGMDGHLRGMSSQHMGEMQAARWNGAVKWAREVADKIGGSKCESLGELGGGWESNNITVIWRWQCTSFKVIRGQSEWREREEAAQNIEKVQYMLIYAHISGSKWSCFYIQKHSGQSLSSSSNPLLVYLLRSSVYSKEEKSNMVQMEWGTRIGRYCWPDDIMTPWVPQMWSISCYQREQEWSYLPEVALEHFLQRSYVSAIVSSGFHFSTDLGGAS